MTEIGGRMKEGDVVRGDRGDFKIGRLVATQGKEGCTDVRCTRHGDRCIGWHCPYCGKPTSSQGDGCTEKPA